LKISRPGANGTIPEPLLGVLICSKKKPREMAVRRICSVCSPDSSRIIGVTDRTRNCKGLDGPPKTVERGHPVSYHFSMKLKHSDE
jgi:hypothetical protein